MCVYGGWGGGGEGVARLWVGASVDVGEGEEQSEIYNTLLN